jgi:hypothetical protein
MKTTSQLRAEFYNAIVGNTAISDIISTRLYWIGKLTVSDTFPLITYAKYDVSGEYSYGFNQESEDVIFETRIYTDNISEMDILAQELKETLLTIGYRNINSPAEFTDTDINKNVSIIRWEKLNT